MSSPGAGTPSITYSPYYSNSGMSNAKFNPTMAVIIIVLIGSCFVLGFISVFVRKCMSGSQVAGAMGTEAWNPKARGLDKEALDALPLVHCSDLGEKDDPECPVCLTEFEPEDSLRLLPTCRHVFHRECIDAWFDAHSTCPLCRASLTGAVVTSGEQGASQEPAVATVTEVSESGDSDIEILQPTPPREDSSQPTGAMATVGATISREDSLNSARGTLSRNSQSFKRAARGVTVLEKAQSLGAVQLNRKSPSSRKPPLTPSTSATDIRRSSSLGTDLVALRNLLMGGDLSGVPTATTATSSSWFTRARSMDLGRTRSRNLPRTKSGDNIDLESGKLSGESSTAASHSDRWRLASLRGAILPLTRSTSDVMSRMNNPRNLPV